MTWVSVGVAAVGVTTSIVKGVKANKERKKLEKNRPKYKISKQAFENREIAKREAFGTPTEITTAKTALDQNVADTMGQATKISDSGSGILATLSAINSQKQRSYLGLANQEASIKNQRLGDLYRANRNMIDEQDKAFEYNLAAPYADQLTSARERRRQAEEDGWESASVAGSGVSSYIQGRK